MSKAEKRRTEFHGSGFFFLLMLTSGCNGNRFSNQNIEKRPKTEVNNENASRTTWAWARDVDKTAGLRCGEGSGGRKLFRRWKVSGSLRNDEE